MSRDAHRTLAVFFRRLLVTLAFVVGMTLTWASAWTGTQIASLYVYGFRCCPARTSTSKLRVKAARDAVTQYMIETPSCPRSVQELVAGKYLDKSLAIDPWGSALMMRCPGLNDVDGADVSSAGPDKIFGTADDINSWDL
jgi:hypothetical protein